MKNIALILLLLLPLAALAQFPANPSKVILGRQTTAQGLVPVTSAAPGWTPANWRNDAYTALDTLNAVMWCWDGAGQAWVQCSGAGGGIDTLFVVSDTLFWEKGDSLFFALLPSGSGGGGGKPGIVLPAINAYISQCDTVSLIVFTVTIVGDPDSIVAAAPVFFWGGVPVLDGFLNAGEGQVYYEFSRSVSESDDGVVFSVLLGSDVVDTQVRVAKLSGPCFDAAQVLTWPDTVGVIATKSDLVGGGGIYAGSGIVPADTKAKLTNSLTLETGYTPSPGKSSQEIMRGRHELLANPVFDLVLNYGTDPDWSGFTLTSRAQSSLAANTASFQASGFGAFPTPGLRVGWFGSNIGGPQARVRLGPNPSLTSNSLWAGYDDNDFRVGCSSFYVTNPVTENQGYFLPVTRPSVPSFWRHNADGTGQYVAESSLAGGTDTLLISSIVSDSLAAYTPAVITDGITILGDGTPGDPLRTDPTANILEVSGPTYTLTTSDAAQYSTILFTYATAGGNVSVEVPDTLVFGYYSMRLVKTGPGVLTVTGAGTPRQLSGQFGQHASATLAGDGTAWSLSGNLLPRHCTLTDVAGTVTWDASQCATASLTMAGNYTLAITNSRQGETLVLNTTQNGTGGWTLAWPSGTRFQGGTPLAISSAANAEDLAVFYCRASGFNLEIGKDYED